jgi:hypothetical protein
LFYSDGDELVHKHGINTFETKISYPFTPATRLSVTPHVTNQYFKQFNPNYPNQDLNNFYTGANTELNIDNSEITGTNMRKGVRCRLLFENYLGLTNTAKSFSRLDFDFRLYQPLLNHLVFAFRGAAGTYLGTKTKYFMMGGSDGLVSFSRYNYKGENNPLALATQNIESGNPDIMFDKFVTNVRGYSLNTVYGQNYFLFNAEVRVPIAKFLFGHEAINSIFVRNLQFFYFSDLGAAWTGKDPFSRNNTFSKIAFDNQPFSGYSITYATPVLSSYGFGFRSYVLGYYLKLDFVNPVRDFVVSPKKVILSIGHDF